MLERGRHAVDLSWRETGASGLFTPAANGLSNLACDLPCLGVLQFEVGGYA